MEERTAKAANRIVLIPIMLSILLCGCARKQVQAAKGTESAVKITATFYPLYIMLMNITENVPGVEISLLAPSNTGCLHDYQMTTKDMKAFSACDILVANGGGMEYFLDKAKELKRENLIVASEGYDLVDGNAHIWVSPEGAVFQVMSIADGLSHLDQKHAQEYITNANDYISKIEELSRSMHQVLDGYSGRKIVTFHEAFPYFASEFNLEIASVIEREPGTAPSAREIKNLVEEIKSVGKAALFAEPQYSSSAAQIIAKETGLKVFELDPAVTGKIDKNAYIDAMRKNAATIKEALESLE